MSGEFRVRCPAAIELKAMGVSWTPSNEATAPDVGRRRTVAPQTNDGHECLPRPDYSSGGAELLIDYSRRLH
jgi:hypothetical protein